jgi:hypothetical protein
MNWMTMMLFGCSIPALAFGLVACQSSKPMMETTIRPIQADSFHVRVRNLDYFGNGAMAYISGTGPGVGVLFSLASLEGESSLHLAGVVGDGETFATLGNAEVFSRGYTDQEVKIYSPDGRTQESGRIYRLDSANRVVADRNGKFDVRLMLDSNTQVIFAKEAYFVAVYDFGRIVRGRTSSLQSQP